MDRHTLDKLEFGGVLEVLAGFARTRLGKELAGTVRPARRAEKIRRWLAQVGEMMGVIEGSGVPPLGGISDIRPLIDQATLPVRLECEDFSHIAATLAGTGAMRRWLDELPETAVQLRRLGERVVDFGFLAEQIGRVIDARGEVRDEASPRLRKIRREIAAAEASIEAAFARILRSPTIRKMLQYASTTFHGDRRVLPLRSEHRGRVPGIIHRSSDTGATLFVEPAEVVEINNLIIRLAGEQNQEIGRILWELTQAVHHNAVAIKSTLTALAILDLLTAKAMFAREYQMVVPEVRDDRQLSVRDARHPLLMAMARQRGEPVVPIDVRLGEDFDVLVITGPNTGGKTCTLKTVGLLAMMAQ